MNILFAIPVNKTQAKAVKKTLENIKTSGLYDFGSDRAVIVVANDYLQAEVTKDITLLAQEMFMGYDIYPTHDYDNSSEIAALNHIFRHTSQYCHDVRNDVDGYFFFQPDITPIKKDWWEVAKGEFARSGKFCLYAKMDVLNDKKQSVGSIFNPCAFYHKNCPEKINSFYGNMNVPFNDMSSWSVMENGKQSDVITDVTYNPEIEIDSQKVLIVGDKKGKYSGLLKSGENFIVVRNYELEALPINIKQAVAFLNYRFDKGDAEEIRKEASDSGLMGRLASNPEATVAKAEELKPAEVAATPPKEGWPKAAEPTRKSGTKRLSDFAPKP